MNPIEIKKRLLIQEALRWTGTKEEGSNKGQIVQMFQNWDGSPDVVPYCMSFVQFCLKAVDAQYDAVIGTCDKRHELERSEHCLTVWNKSPRECRIDKPEPGSVVIWQHKSSSSGHTGIIIDWNEGEEYFETVEANTGPGKNVEREGEGVYRKIRSLQGSPTMLVLGYLRPWRMI